MTVPITLNNRPETLIDQARWLAQEHADQTAVIFVEYEGEHRITYGEFFSQAARYAQALEAVGLQAGDLVVLVLPHSEALLYAFWGALLLGAVPSIFPFLNDKLDPNRYFDSVRQLVSREGVRTVITDNELEPPLREHLAGIETLAAILNVKRLQPGSDVGKYLLRRNPARGEDTAFLQHSSGSTGLQKGVMLSHRSVLNQVASYSGVIRLSPEDIIVSWLPLYHDMGLIAGFIMPMVQGIPLVLMSPHHWVRDPKILLQAISCHHGTLCWLPNFAYNFLATRIRDSALEGVDLSSLRALVNCSEPVYAESHHIFLERFARFGFKAEALTTCYAMAENTFAVTQGGMDATVKLDVVERGALREARQAAPALDSVPSLTLVSCGRPITGCEIRVVDDQRRELPERQVGEIALRSDSMLTGYYRHPEATAEVMADGWYFTGDMGYLADGELYITGRKKDLIIVGGKNIYPQDIENLLNDIPGLHPGRASVFGVPNEPMGTEDIAIVAETDTTDIEAQADIMREVRARVAQNTEVTARYVHLVAAKWLVKTSSGKVARRANREKFLAEVLGQQE